MEFYHNSRCRKSREALALLEEKGIDLNVVQYLKDPLSEEVLKSIISKLGISPLDLVRKGEAVYKEQFKGKNFSDDQWIKIMIENPKLIERPIFVNGDNAVIGRPPEDVLRIV